MAANTLGRTGSSRPPLPSTRLRVGLVGFGRAGRAVAAVVLRRPGFTLEWVAQRSTPPSPATAADVLGIDACGRGPLISNHDVDAGELLDTHPVDAIIDFSSASGPAYYGQDAAERGVTIVCAVSNFDVDMSPTFERWAATTRVLWSPNITLGINFLLVAAQALRAIEPDADVEILEEHFRAKQDRSGTAQRIASSLDLDDDCIKSLRAGEIVGNHEILFGMRHQNVRLRHESLTREAFGDGALFAVRHLVRRPPGRYRMEDLLLARMRHLDASAIADAGRRRPAS